MSGKQRAIRLTKLLRNRDPPVPAALCTSITRIPFFCAGMTRDGHIHFEEFVSIVRSKAATGVLFHGEKVNWCLNSFFGVGDTIGFQVGWTKGCTLPHDHE
jgi:hypothetical protein